MESVAVGQAEPGRHKTDPEEGRGKHDEQDHAHGFKVSVIYNGVAKGFQIRPNETVKHLLDQAIQAFGITANVHLLSLFTTGGAELNDGLTINEAGVKPHDELLLRPSAVKGG